MSMLVSTSNNVHFRRLFIWSESLERIFFLFLITFHVSCRVKFSSFSRPQSNLVSSEIQEAFTESLFDSGFR
uniref:Uncharacterized protein n=1 Tax=Rhizophora mucronata TaxID=61149 RepID=A0A2P2JKP3_RHIMU